MGGGQEIGRLSNPESLEALKTIENRDEFGPRRYAIIDVVEVSRSIAILLVEDNPGDVRLIMEAFRDYKESIELDVVEDGVEALAFLRREGRYADALRPDLILLDLNLPKKNGREVLIEIKADETLRRIPVVVLTASQAREDILEAYDLNANSYVAKPFDFDQFIKVLTTIQDFWLSAVRLPEE